MNFIDRWKQAWKFISVQCFAAITAGQGAVGLVKVLGINEDIYSQHGTLIGTVTIALAFCGGFGVLIQQDTLPDWVPSFWKPKPPAQCEEKKP
jgi:hypothetical protein